MARIRTIKPEFFKNEQLAELPAMSRLLFIGLWTLADRAGRLEDRPKRIKADVFPYDNMDVEKALNDLQSKGFIIRYKGNANITDRILPPEQPTTELNCIEIINFLKHQKIDGYNEKPSLLPASQPQDLLKTIPSLVIDGEGKGRERKEFCRLRRKRKMNLFLMKLRLNHLKVSKHGWMKTPLRLQKWKYQSLLSNFLSCVGYCLIVKG